MNEQKMVKGIMENAGMMLAYLDSQFNFLAVNTAYAKSSGHKVEELVGKNHFDLFPNPENQSIFEKVRETGKSIKFLDKPFRFVDQPDRGVTYWDWTLSPIKDSTGAVQALVLSLFETTDRKQAEKALRKSEKKFRSLFTNMIDACAYHKIVYDSLGEPVDYIFLEVNSAFEEFTGLNKSNIIGKRVTKILPDINADPANWIQKFGKVANRGQHIRFEGYSTSLKKWFFASAYCPEDGHFVAIFEDLSDRKDLEKELISTLDDAQKRQSEVSALLEASKAVLRHKSFKKASRSIFNSCKMLIGATAGYVALLNEELNQNAVLFLDSGGLRCTVDPTLIMPIRGLRAESYSKGKSVHNNDFPSSEWSKFLPKGHMVLKNVLFVPLTIDTKTVGLIGLANKPEGFSDHDVNVALAFGELASIALLNSRILDSLEEKERQLQKHAEYLEELVEEKTRKLKLAERLAAIGETAGMIGHDIRNPLQSIDGALYLAKDYVKSLPEDCEEKKDLEEIHELLREQVAYVDHIVADLQDFARDLSPKFEEINLSEAIKESLYSIEIPEKITVNLILPKTPIKVYVDPIHSKRVFVNLFKNAVQAMPDGGDLTIMAFHKDGCVLIRVEDTGLGISDDVKPHIFTPLFTTKPKGQGFGLPVCKKLIEAQGGEISFQSKEGKGSTFIIKFPDELKNLTI